MNAWSMCKVLILFALTSIGAPSHAEQVRLEPEEVKNIFIGKPWHGPSGAFLFREDGTYTYKDFDQEQPRGTWKYKFREDGVLEGHTTEYEFYRYQEDDKKGYRYWHSRSRKHYEALPNQRPFLGNR